VAGEKRKLHGILAVVLGVVALGLMMFLIYVQVGALREAREAAAAERAALAGAKAQLEKLLDMRDQAPLWEARLAAAERLIPREPDENRLVSDMQDVAGRANTELLQVRFEERAARENFVEMPVKIAFQGRYHGLLDLLEDLEGGARAVRVDEVKVGRGRDGLPQIRADITAAVFCQEAEGTVGK